MANREDVSLSRLLLDCPMPANSLRLQVVGRGGDWHGNATMGDGGVVFRNAGDAVRMLAELRTLCANVERQILSSTASFDGLSEESLRGRLDALLETEEFSLDQRESVTVISDRPKG